MSTYAWIGILLALLLLAGISVGIAYSRGKATAIVPTQYNEKALAEAKAAQAKAEADLKAVEAEANKARTELDSILTMKNEQDRLKALAAFANKRKLP
jgi:Skp family chaperone for outer membrane proteins